MRRQKGFIKLAMSWILGYLASNAYISAGPHQFTELVYADDAAVFLFDEVQAGEALQNSNVATFSLKGLDQKAAPRFGHSGEYSGH